MIAPFRLERHWLAYPRPSATDSVLGQVDRSELLAPVKQWMSGGWPLVVTRQTADSARIALGIPFPPASGNVKLRVCLSAAELASVTAPKSLQEILPCAPSGWRRAIGDLSARTRSADLDVRVFGSIAWSAITGWDYQSPGSDLDLTVGIRHISQVGYLHELLSGWERRFGRRADAELMFPSGRYVALREWMSVGASGSPVTDVIAKSLLAVDRVAASDLVQELSS